MSCRMIQMVIPANETVPEEITGFSPEENYQMIKIGSECLLEARKVVAGLSQKEIYEKIKAESEEEIQRLERNILLEKEFTQKMEERISKMYEGQVDKLEKQIAFLSKQVKTYELENNDMIQKEAERLREKYDLLLKEKDIQNQLNRDVFDKATLLINKSVNKSSASIGDDGENTFESLSETFKDFNGYKIENKSKQGHKGDFHLYFEEFNVLVDAKNYSGTVQKKEVNKIESDLRVNDNMNFAWMVSLNTPISDQNRFPITSKWISTDVGIKIILFINNLLSEKEPANLLRQAWYMSYEMNKFIKNTMKEDGELEKYREKELKQKKQIEHLRERINELKRNVNTSTNILKNMDTDLMEMLSEVSEKIVKEMFMLNEKINTWWDVNVEFVNDESRLTSSEIWNKFKSENKDFILENKLTIEQFKEKLTSIVCSANYIEKNKKGVIEFIGFRLKEIEKKEAPIKKNKKNNVLSSSYYFSEEADDKILHEYQDESNNIITIGEKNNIRPWEVVSLLIRHKVISKRDESRGYDIYKETEEYKEKCKK